MAALTIEILAERLFPTRPEFLSVREVVEHTSLSESTVRRRLSDGTLESVRLGRRRLIKMSSIESLNDE